MAIQTLDRQQCRSTLPFFFLSLLDSVNVYNVQGLDYSAGFEIEAMGMWMLLCFLSVKSGKLEGFYNKSWFQVIRSSLQKVSSLTRVISAKSAKVSSLTHSLTDVHHF